MPIPMHADMHMHMHTGMADVAPPSPRVRPTGKIEKLIGDSKLRGRMGEAGREETLKWNWQSATSVLRNLQYTRAERNFAERQRWWSRQWSWLPWKWGSSSGDEPSPQPLTA